jgi:23S rRNA (cytosine1962-C5)-methyltransferase
MMSSPQFKKYPHFQLHPQSIRMISQGHWWVTLDRFSGKIPQDVDLFWGQEQSAQAVGLFFHDPQHPHIKARLWAQSPEETTLDFMTLLQRRLSEAFAKRKELLHQKKIHRTHFYWCFGEGDQLPGLFILQLGSHLIIQMYAFYWKNHLPKIYDYLKAELETTSFFLWTHERVKLTSQPSLPVPQIISVSGFRAPNDITPQSMIAQEGPFKIHLKLGQTYDYGLYTDMAAIRENLLAEFSFKQKRVLNLYAYTGAFSLMALAAEAQYVLSVDLSAKYCEWMRENIELNFSDSSAHDIWQCSVEKALQQCIDQKNTFDVIIIDPPSFSGDGKKRISAQEMYNKQISILSQLLSREGILITFLNNHSINLKKFQNIFTEKMGPQFQFISAYKLHQDCPTLKGFPEGDYLKGLSWRKKS